MKDTVILRRRVESNFTTFPNELIRDNRLSWKALGLLAYLLAHPADFRLNLVYLAKQRPSGRDATRSALRELEAAGYVSIERSHDDMGRFSTTTWMVSQTPDFVPVSPCAENPNTVKPTEEKPKAERPTSDKPTLISTETEQKLRIKKTTTTKQEVRALERPSGLAEKYWPAIENLLIDIPLMDAKELLDELTQALKIGSIKTTPIKWFHGVLLRYKAGQFVPSQPLKKRVESLNKASRAPGVMLDKDRGLGNEYLKQMKTKTSLAGPSR
ncbi:hypothetical protein PH586_14890 [Pseudomonas sp. SA3-5]|uniref:Helix-turn-helix domain-containing protein n=1 Tax=Pseudomonas aestuarii TaxID=3018340 RepID=A0ABT4XHJ9_9PSED|nr:hypothetical protein [Pseudomonas aestuarii]MDA7087675.1 hypothetical protein [Pseudomonas aestuarii]